MIYVGIDPGADGAVVLMNDTHLTYYKTADLDDEASLVCDAIAELRPANTRIAIEDLHALGLIQATTNFALGWSCGYWHGVCNANGHIPVRINPKTWQALVTKAPPKPFIPSYLPKALKQKLNSQHKDDLKAESICTSNEHFPDYNITHDGVADAVCIALCLRYQDRLKQ